MTNIVGKLLSLQPKILVWRLFLCQSPIGGLRFFSNFDLCVIWSWHQCSVNRARWLAQNYYKSWHRVNAVPIHCQYANIYGVKQHSPKSLNTRCCHNVESFATERSSRQIWETLSMYWTGSFPRINNWKTPQNTILINVVLLYCITVNIILISVGVPTHK